MSRQVTIKQNAWTLTRSLGIAHESDEGAEERGDLCADVLRFTKNKGETKSLFLKSQVCLKS